MVGPVMIMAAKVLATTPANKIDGTVVDSILEVTRTILGVHGVPAQRVPDCCADYDRRRHLLAAEEQLGQCRRGMCYWWRIPFFYGRGSWHV